MTKQHQPAIPILGIYPKEIKSFVLKRHLHTVFTAALFTIAKTWKQPQRQRKYDIYFADIIITLFS